MVKTIWDYPVSYIYGYSEAYGGNHTGEDRGDVSAFSLPVTVNGVTIGTVGWTGYVQPRSKFGTHLHVGKWKDGKSHDPKGGGATFRQAVITEIDRRGLTANGKFVRVQGDGYSWVYLHLDSIPTELILGQRLEEDMYKGKDAEYWGKKYEAELKRSENRKNRILAAHKALQVD